MPPRLVKKPTPLALPLPVFPLVSHSSASFSFRLHFDGLPLSLPSAPLANLAPKHHARLAGNERTSLASQSTGPARSGILGVFCASSSSSSSSMSSQQTTPPPPAQSKTSTHYTPKMHQSRHKRHTHPKPPIKHIKQTRKQAADTVKSTHTHKHPKCKTKPPPPPSQTGRVCTHKVR